jgi:hypothetical protein
MKFAAGLLSDPPVGALLCAVLLIVSRPRDHTLGHQFDDDAFFGPKASKVGKSLGWTLTYSTLLKKQRCGLRQRTPQIRQGSPASKCPSAFVLFIGRRPLRVRVDRRCVAIIEKLSAAKRPRLISESAPVRSRQFLLEPRYPSQVAAICDAL